MILGQKLLKFAFTQICESQFIIGRKPVYIEYANTSKLYNSYFSAQFIQFSQCKREMNEISESPILVQALKYSLKSQKQGIVSLRSFPCFYASYYVTIKTEPFFIS